MRISSLEFLPRSRFVTRDTKISPTLLDSEGPEGGENDRSRSGGLEAFVLLGYPECAFNVSQMLCCNSGQMFC